MHHHPSAGMEAQGTHGETSTLTACRGIWSLGLFPSSTKTEPWGLAVRTYTDFQGSAWDWEASHSPVFVYVFNLFRSVFSPFVVS